MDNKLSDYLLANPFNRETNFDKKLDESTFFDKDKGYFVECPSYAITSNQLDSVFESASYQRMLSIFLYGYTGSGKTTYLRWYLRKLKAEYNIVFFDFSNSTKSPDEKETKDTIKIFDKYFQDKMLYLFHLDGKDISNMLAAIYAKILSIGDVFSQHFFESLHKLLEKGTNIDKYEYKKFINLLGYKDLMLLLLISYYEYPNLFSSAFKINIDKTKPLLLILDNIDHIDIESHNSRFPANIEHTFSNLKDYYEHSPKSELVKIHFIFSLRDANCTLISRQLGDVYHRNKVFFHPLVNNISTILHRRLLIAKQNGISFTKEQEFLIDFILSDDYTNKVFLPLFNYNYRKFALLLSEFLQDSNNEIILEIKQLLSTNDTKNGARGIIFYLIINFLFTSDFLEERLFLDPGEKISGYNGGNVNPARILLTNLHNLSKFSFNKFSNTPHVNPVGIYTLYKTFSEIFKNHDDLFFSIISDLFLFHKGNWCHLLTFVDKQVFSENSFEKEKELLQLAKKNDINAINKLENVKLHINPSGFIYLRDIMKSYEFFSIRSGNLKPLFSSLDYELVDDKIEFDFLKNIDATFELTEKCLGGLIKFLEADIVKNFENSNHCFRTYHLDDDSMEDFFENQVGRLYLIRIIDTHIQYIDTLKRYLMDYSPTYSRLFENKDNLINFRNLKVKINKELTLRIEKYLNILQKNKGILKVNNLITLYLENLNMIKLNYNEFHSINFSRKPQK